jgi:hypothetical protein
MLERRALKMSDPGGERQPIVKKGLIAGHAPEAIEIAMDKRSTANRTSPFSASLTLN